MKLRGYRGFTVMEVLLATALTIILGLILIALLRMAVSNWRTAEDQREAHATAQIALRQIAEDLESLAGPDLTAATSSARLVCHYVPVDHPYTLPSMRASPPRDGFGYPIGDHVDNDLNAGPDEELLNNQDEDVDGLIDEDLSGRGFPQTMLLVRHIYGEDQIPELRTAGDGINNDADFLTDEEFYNLVDDDADNKIDEDVMATGGLMEVVYVLTAATDAYVLRRGVRSPPSGAFTTAPPDQNGDGRPDWELWPALAEDVLHFGVTFLYSDGAGNERATGVWDSTRALYRYTSGIGSNEFREYRSYTSLGDPTDDIFPRMARVTLVLKPRTRAVKSTILVSGVSALTTPDPYENIIEVQSTRGFTRPLWPLPSTPNMLPLDPQAPFGALPGQYILVDREWMLVTEVHERDKLPYEDRVASWFRVYADGLRVPARNSWRTSHEIVGPDGRPTLVREGWAFSRDIFIPLHREKAFSLYP